MSFACPAGGYGDIALEPDGSFLQVATGKRIDLVWPRGFALIVVGRVAKLIASGRTFEEARRRMAIALEEFKIEGVKTTIPLHRLLLENEAFKRQEFAVSFMERHQIAEQLAREMDRREASLLERGAVLAASLIELGETANGGMSPDREGNSAQERGAPRHYDAI